MANPNIYTTGGTVQANDGLYIARKADADLLKLCREGGFGYVLSSRQVGKSSLMVRTEKALQDEHIMTAEIDLSAIGTKLKVEQWYCGLLAQIENACRPKTDLLTWWGQHTQLPVVQRFTRYFEDVLLREINQQIVIFIDEIDTTLSLDFTDDFFAAIRALYNSRARVPELRRLSFVLIGVATPSDLIRDPQRTPFNIGTRIDLADFTLEEALPLAGGLGLPLNEARQVLTWVLEWTGGHPYLTQRLCSKISMVVQGGQGGWRKEAVDGVVRELFLGKESDQDPNLTFVRDMLTERAKPDKITVLSTYKIIRLGKTPVPDEEQSVVKSHLKLSGVVRRELTALRVRNGIYREVFDNNWISSYLPEPSPNEESQSRRIGRARPQNDHVFLAKSILGGQAATLAEVFGLVTELKKERAFGLARKLLDKYAGDPAVRADATARIKLAQQRALCTYKDPDLLSDEKLDAALQILKEGDDLTRTTDRETLGLAGAIYKRKWEIEGHERDLEQSLYYYERGYCNGTTEDYGWTGINAAFVLDLLADHESSISDGKAGQELNTSDLRRKRANEIRREIASRLPPLLADSKNEWLKNEWWFWATLGEAHFGIDAFTEAGTFLSKANALPAVADWERESTARQLATLLLLIRKTSPETAEAAQKCLFEFLGNDYALTSVIRGKIGLAFSGGGFRASLYHIGVLAKLAELDLLRSVEYLSCVSGGSIIGAYYYLEMRRLLQTKADDEITRQDYIDLVRRIEKEFLAGVQRNIRTRVLSEWRTSVKMIFVPEYSRTTRAGELYESELYARVNDGEGHVPRWLDELLIIPKGEDPTRFRPKDHNWRRSNKVPILILNATSLNTGHNWQFTATWMGEPPGTIDTIDANYRLRRMYYDEAPGGNRKVRLGHAVAASACVPGIFEPIPLNHLYEREIPKYERDGKQDVVEPIVRLVDGGVHDNQGVAALLDQGCNVFIVSDASGQMNALDFPSNKILGVPLRANDILQARVREAQYRELCSRRRSGLLKGFMFIHLKKDLQIELLDWIDCQDPSERKTISPLTPYGVQREIQRRLASVRTDLDSFSDAEAYALMCSGYLMAEHALSDEKLLGFDVPQSQREAWAFLKIEELMKQPPQNNPLISQLKVSDRLFWKIWLLSRPVRIIGGIAALGIVLVLARLMWTLWTKQLLLLSWGELIILLAALLLGTIVFEKLSGAFNYRKTLDQILIGLGLTVGSLLAKVHLYVFDKLFLWQGRIDRISRGRKPGSA